MCRLKSLVAICFAVLLAGCAGGPQTQPPTLNLRRLSDQDSPLALAVRLLEQINNLNERVDIANGIADAYIAQERIAAAGFVLDYAAQLAPFVGGSPRGVAATAEIAGLYGRIDRDPEALALLRQAQERAFAITNDRERGDALDAVIGAAFSIGEEAFDLLGSTVESLFVIDDPAVRAQLLTDTAMRFHQAGNRTTMHSLIQQAIPAAGSIANPWHRAAAISELAAVYLRTGNSDAAISTIDEAIDEIRRLGNGAAPSADAPFLLHTLNNVVLLAQQLSAVELVERLEQPAQRAQGLTAVAVGYGQQRARSASYIFFSRAVREASLVAEPEERVAAMIVVAEGYIRAGDAELAVIQANGAGSVVLQIAGEEEQISAGRRVAAVYAAAGEVDRADRFLSDLPSGAVRWAVQVAFARELLRHGRADEGRLLLQSAFGEPPGGRPRTGDAAAAGLAADVAPAFAAAGDTERTLRWIALSDNAAEAARALTALGRRGVTGEQLSEAERAILGRLGSELAGR